MAKKTVIEETVQPTNDAYTGMLGLSLAALLVGCGLLFLDLQNYDWKKEPPKVQMPTVKQPAQP